MFKSKTLLILIVMYIRVNKPNIKNLKCLNKTLRKQF